MADFDRVEKLTPMHLNWALVFHFSGDPEGVLGSEHFNSVAGRDVFDWLKREGLIGDAPMYRGTERLRAFVEHLCRQPLPVQAWVQPDAT